MELHLVVRHRNDTTGKFKAEWTDDNTIKWTECNDKTLADCKQQMNNNKDGWVFIYRTAFNGGKNTICCRAKIAKVDDGAKKVFFKDWQTMNTTPTWTADANTYSKWVAAADNANTGGKNGKMKKTA